MKKWEYLSIETDSVSVEGATDNVLKVRWVNDEEVPDWEKGLSLFKFLSQLGSEGWEVVSDEIVSTRKWKYWSTVLEADAKKQADFFKTLTSNNPTKPDPAAFQPEALIPELDEMGKKGWELVSIQPVILGRNADVFNYAGFTITGLQRGWTNIYLCVFKTNAARGVRHVMLKREKTDLQDIQKDMWNITGLDEK